MSDYNITIRHLTTGKTVQICRDVCVTHPEWVHAQLGTSSESELQSMLDAYNVSDYYDANGRHRGPDVLGVTMERVES